LPQGKLNAVRAAFKAGVTPNRIAREFGISRSDVQRALAGEAKKW
jgi:transposase-like protein